MMFKKWIVVLLFVLIGVLVIQNIQSVTIQFLFWKASMSRVFLYLVLFLTGMIAGYLLCLIRFHSKESGPSG